MSPGGPGRSRAAPGGIYPHPPWMYNVFKVVEMGFAGEVFINEAKERSGLSKKDFGGHGAGAQVPFCCFGAIIGGQP